MQKNIWRSFIPSTVYIGSWVISLDEEALGMEGISLMLGPECISTTGKLSFT